MTNNQANVRAFMLAAGQECPIVPTLPNDAVRLLRMRLIKEEYVELCNSFANNDLVEVADAVGDLLVVVIGTAVACGIDIDPIFCEIHNSNMTKFIDGHKDEGGKWIKGPSYRPANLKPILIDQGANL